MSAIVDNNVRYKTRSCKLAPEKKLYTKECILEFLNIGCLDDFGSVSPKLLFTFCEIPEDLLMFAIDEYCKKFSIDKSDRYMFVSIRCNLSLGFVKENIKILPLGKFHYQIHRPASNGRKYMETQDYLLDVKDLTSDIISQNTNGSFIDGLLANPNFSDSEKDKIIEMYGELI